MTHTDTSGIRKAPSERMSFVLRWLLRVLILKVTITVILNYGDYLPPDFNSDFLRGRQAYFAGSYQWAFYGHIAAGPCVLVLGMIQLSERLRLRYPWWHRSLGKLQIASILLVLTPSGLWMAFYAETGAVAGVAFASLSAVTAATAWCGWRAAVRRRFAAHRLWMGRCFLLLCSAVVIRVISGIVIVTGIQGDWTYPLAAWVSWLAPLAVFERLRLWRGEIGPQLEQSAQAAG